MPQRTGVLGSQRCVVAFTLMLLTVVLCGALTARAHADTTYTVSGTVTSLPGHNVLGDVKIEAIDSIFHAPVATTTTDTSDGPAKGTFSLQVPVGEYTFRATPPSGSQFSPATTQPYTVDRDTTVDIGLVRPGLSVVQGTLTDRDGSPLRDVNLYLNGATSFASGRTDASGRYVVAVPDGQYRLQVQDYGNNSLAAVPHTFSLESATDAITVDGPAVKDIQVRAHKVSVRVLDEDGNAVEGASVRGSTGGTTQVLGSTWSGFTADYPTTGTDGVADYYTFDTTAGHQLYVAPPSGAELANQTVLLDATTSDRQITVRLRKVFRVSGTITDRDGSPLRDVNLYLNGPESSGSGRTDASGRYVVAVPDGQYRLQVQDYGNNSLAAVPHTFSLESATDAITVDGPAVKDIQVRAHKVSVRVLDEDGNAVEGASVRGSTGGTTQVLGSTWSGFTADYPTTGTDGVADYYAFDTTARHTLTVTPPAGTAMANAYLPIPPINGDSIITLSYVGGVPSAVALTPNRPDFGHVAIGETSATQDITVSNILGGDVTPSQVVLIGDDASDFRMIDDRCTGTTLHELGSCVVTVAYTPADYGPAAAQLRITDNGPGSPRRAILSGFGKDVVDPTIAIAVPVHGQEISQGSEAIADYSCADEASGSGVDTCVGSVENGGALDTNTLGARTFTVTASDRAGNEARRTVTYTVVDPDRDNDGVRDDVDNCVADANPDQRDMDGDEIGDVCDADRDGDGSANDVDNCADDANPGQEDLDQDRRGDICDDDRDGDTVLNEADNCPDMSNDGQEDADGDGMGDLCDADRDGDGVPDSSDNCVAAANADQADDDGDAVGNVCDPDLDGDGVGNATDNCAGVANADQGDDDADGIGDACDTQRAAPFQIGKLIDTIAGLDINAGIGRSLTAKLRNALEAANAGDLDAACRRIGSFVSEVEAQAKGNLSEHADSLLAEAARIAHTLGCPS